MEHPVGSLPDSPSTPPPYTWVACFNDFDRMAATLKGSPRIAVDIEADSLYHYFEKVCLVQISTDSETYILDPLAVKDLSALAPVMSDPAKEKVFHAANYDIHCLRRDYGFGFANIFDTHIAAQLAGYEYLGLDALMEELLGIAHSKHRQRDNWSVRPLESEQLEYAAMDTHHLLRLRDMLEAQLVGMGRFEWACEEFEAAAINQNGEREFDPEGFRRIKGSRQLSEKALAILRALYLLRDKYAREMDMPPFKVMNNSVLLDLARNVPNSAQEMFKRPGISYRVARKFGWEIIRTISHAHSGDTTSVEKPARTLWKAPSRETKARLEKLKLWRISKANELQLHIGVVFPGNLLEILATAPPEDVGALAKIPGMRQWRVKAFGTEILQALQLN